MYIYIYIYINRLSRFCPLPATLACVPPIHKQKITSVGGFTLYTHTFLFIHISVSIYERFQHPFRLKRNKKERWFKGALQLLINRYG